MGERVEQLTLAERIKRICDLIEKMSWECNVPAEEQEALIRDMRWLCALLHEVKIPDKCKTTARVVRTSIQADMVQRAVTTLTVNYPPATTRADFAHLLPTPHRITPECVLRNPTMRALLAHVMPEVDVEQYLLEQKAKEAQA